MRENFKSFKEDQEFRITLKHFANSRYHTESIYAKFKKATYLGDTEIVDELHISQIIDIEAFLNGEDYREIDRIIKSPRNYTGSIGYRMEDIR